MGNIEHLLKIVGEVLGPSTGYELLHRKDLAKYLTKRPKPIVICSVQDCNMGGEYLRNYFVDGVMLYWYVTGIDHFDQDEEYDSTLVKEYVWRRVKKNVP